MRFAQMTIAHKSTTDIKEKARQLGMRTLKESGMQLVEEGLTSEAEIMRVVEMEK